MNIWTVRDGHAKPRPSDCPELSAAGQVNKTSGKLPPRRACRNLTNLYVSYNNPDFTPDLRIFTEAFDWGRRGGFRMQFQWSHRRKLPSHLDGRIIMRYASQYPASSPVRYFFAVAAARAVDLPPSSSNYPHQAAEKEGTTSPASPTYTCLGNHPSAPVATATAHAKKTDSLRLEE